MALPRLFRGSLSYMPATTLPRATSNSTKLPQKRFIAYKYKKIPTYINLLRYKKLAVVAGHIRRALDARFEPQKVLWISVEGIWKVTQYAVLGIAAFKMYVGALDYMTGWEIWFDEDEH